MNTPRLPDSKLAAAPSNNYQTVSYFITSNQEQAIPKMPLAWLRWWKSLGILTTALTGRLIAGYEPFRVSSLQSFSWWNNLSAMLRNHVSRLRSIDTEALFEWCHVTSSFGRISRSYQNSNWRLQSSFDWLHYVHNRSLHSKTVDDGLDPDDLRYVISRSYFKSPDLL